jgi:hypothetical protein
MNHSIYSADRTTHLKIMVVALVAGIGRAGLGLLCRAANSDAASTEIAGVGKAGKPMTANRSGVWLPDK